MDDHEIHPTASLESWFGVVEEEVVEFLDKDLDAVIPDVSVCDIAEEIEKLTENALSPAVITGIVEEEKKDEVSEQKVGKKKLDGEGESSKRALPLESHSEDLPLESVSKALPLETASKDNSVKEKSAIMIDDELKNANGQCQKSLEDIEEDFMEEEIAEEVEEEEDAVEKLPEPKSANTSRRVSEENDASTAIGDSYQSEYESGGSENGTESNTEHVDGGDKHSHIDESPLYLNEDETDESGLKTRFNLRKRLPIHSVNEEYGSDDFDQESDSCKVAKRLKLSFSKKNYRRQRPYTNEAVKIAVKMVMSKKMSLQEASREFKIPRTSLHNFVTLYKRGRRTGVRTISPGLTKSEEAEMVSLIMKLSRCGKRYSHNELRFLVQYYLVSNDRPVFKSGTLPTMGWIAGLVERQQELVKAKSKKNTKVAIEDVEEWQEQIEDYLVNDWDLDVTEMFNHQNGNRIYCFNALRFLINSPGENAEKPSPVKKEPGTEDEKSDLELGVILGMSAAGRFVEPLIIIPEDKREIYDIEDSDRIRIIFNKSGKVDEDVALKVVKDFDVDIVSRRIPKPVVFFVNDKHDLAHFSVIEYCWENQIIIICLPPRTTKTMTPFEINIWPKLRSAYSNLWKNAPKSFDNKISPERFIALFGKAWESVTIPQLAVRGFMKSGLIPLNVPSILKDSSSDLSEQQIQIQHQIDQETQLQQIKQQNEFSMAHQNHFMLPSNSQDTSSDIPDLSPMEERSRGKLEGIEMCLKVIENFIPPDVLPVWNQRRADYRGRCELAFKLWRSVSLLLKAGCAMASIQQMADGFFNPFGADFSSTATFFQKPLAPVNSAPSVVSGCSSRSESPVPPPPRPPRPRPPPQFVKAQKRNEKPIPKKKKLKINKSIYSRPKASFTNGDNGSPTEAPPFVKLYSNPFLMNEEIFDEGEEM